MEFSRRKFNHLIMGSVGLGLIPRPFSSPSTNGPSILKAKRLSQGDLVGIVSPAGITHDPEGLNIMIESLQALGLKVKVGEHALERWGYFAGRDEERVADLHDMFSDPEVKGIFCLAGGWGAARLLQKLDFDLISRNPKILMGFSDITSLLLAIYSRTGLITFHGPNGNSTWNSYSVDFVKSILFEAETVLMQNPKSSGDELTITDNRVRTIHGGKAKGRLLGGNLTVLSSIVGSSYLPDWEDGILFLEDVAEGIYRIDRMLTQLKLAGILDKLNGVVFGNCSRCGADSGYSSFTMMEVLTHHFQDLGIPVWSGAMIGHIRDKFTIPVGAEVEIDADEGSIQMLESAVL